MRSVRPILTVAVGVLIVLYATTLIVNGIPRVLAKRSEIQQMQKHNDEMAKRLAEKQLEQDNLTSDAGTIDREIRKGLGANKPTTEVFDYPKGEASDDVAPSPQKTK